MVGTGANRMPLTKIHPILLGKQKAEGTSLLAWHKQQFEERRQDQHLSVDNSIDRGGSYTPSNQWLPNQPPPNQPSRNQPLPNQHQMQNQGMHMQPPLHVPSHHQSRFGGGTGEPPLPLPAVTYPPSPGLYQRPNPIPFPMAPPQGQVPAQPPLPAFVPPVQPPLPVGPAQPPLPVGSAQPPPPPVGNSQVGKSPIPNFSDSHDGRTPDRDTAPLKKKRKSRWGAVEDKAAITGPITTLPANLTEEQRKQYLIQFKIEEITQKLRTGELGIPLDPSDRSPSPEPIYNSEGKRLNTREFRVRKQLEEERHRLIKQAIEEVPNYKPPIDYKPPASKICDKVFIPAERNPAVNFIGLLIGPRGNTLKRLEKETGCKIIIRGKGSVKEGKVGRIPGQLMPGEDEPLHALITGPTEEEVKKGLQVVGDIVKEGIECPDAANELRRNQLRELAELNGTLIDDEVIKCKNCGLTDHRHWECTERKNVTSEISCTKCGGYGHVAVDCKVKVEGNAAPAQTFAEKAKMDTEYMSLMAELGVDAPPPPPPKSVLLKDPPPSASTSNSASSGGTSTPLLPAPPFSSEILSTPSTSMTQVPHPRNMNSPPSNMNAPPPNMNASPPNMNAPPPNMNARPTNLSGTPENRSIGPNNTHSGRNGNNKWGPSPPRKNTVPQSLMDVNLGSNVGSRGMPDLNKFGGPRSDGMFGTRGDDRMYRSRMSGPRPDDPHDVDSLWRSRGGQGPTMQLQNDSQGRRGNNTVLPWQQRGPGSGPPPSSNFRTPPSNIGFGPSQGPPPQNNHMERPPIDNTPNLRAPPPSSQAVSYPPPNHWSQPRNFNDTQMSPPSSFGNLPPHWANEPPPPPPPE